MNTVSLDTARPAVAAGKAPVLSVEHLCKIYPVGGGLFKPPRPLRAVDDVCLTVQRGETLGIVGESGSGKTTLSWMMLGLLRPTSGEMTVEGRPIASFDRLEIARKIQPIFQDPYSSLNPRQTIGEIVGAPLVVHRVGDAAQRARLVREIMDKVGLPARFAHAYPSQMSGGQRQRVAIARALVLKPEIVVCDEPTSALDVSVQAQILNLLKDLRQELGLTYVFVSHDLGVVEYISDRVAVMYMGRVVETGRAARLMSAPRHPYTQALMGSILTPDPALGLPELHLGRGFPDPLNAPAGCRFHPRCPEAADICRTTAPPQRHDEQGMVECHLRGGAPAQVISWKTGT